MNINMNEKAYEYLTKKGLAFKVKLEVASCWSGTRKNLWSGAVKEVENEAFYNVYDYKGIKIYVHKNVRTGSSIDIILKSNSLLLGPVFEVNV